MKVFVYSKKTSKEIVRLRDICFVTQYPNSHRIVFTNSEGDSFEYDTQEVKTTIYQN